MSHAAQEGGRGPQRTREKLCVELDGGAVMRGRREHWRRYRTFRRLAMLGFGVNVATSLCRCLYKQLYGRAFAFVIGMQVSLRRSEIRVSHELHERSWVHSLCPEQ